MSSLVPLILAGLLAMPPGPGPGCPPDAPPREGFGPPGDISKFVEHVADAVNATQEQVKQLEAIAKEHQEAARAKREQVLQERGEELKVLREQMREAKRAGDRDCVREIRGQMRGIFGEPPGDLMRQTHDKIAAILTAEQRIAFEEMIHKHRQRRHQRGEHLRDVMSGTGIYRFINRVAEQVGATQEQQKQFRIIAAEHVRAVKAAEAEQAITMEENREELQSLRRRLREARRAGNEEEIEALREKIHAIMSAPVQDVLKSTRDKIAAALTDEQKPEFEAMLQEVREHRGQRIKGRPHHFRGGGERFRRGAHAPPPEPKDKS